MHRQTQRFLVQSFSLLNALFLAFQPLLAVPLVLSTPVAVQAETAVAPESVDLSFNPSSHEFELRVKTDSSLPYVLTYVDESQDPVVEQAATGDLEEIESGVYGDTIYAGTCSNQVCTPSIVNSGVLQVGDQLKMEYRIVNGQVVMGGANSLEQECLAPDAERLTAGETLWTVDKDQQTAETQSAVKLGVAYQFPLDDKVSVTFTCLPKDESARTSFKIQQIAVEELALPDTVKTDSKYAYDITTEMTDGTFDYELTLPKEEGVDAEVVYIEKSLEEVKASVLLDDVITVVETEDVKIEQNSNSDKVTVQGLDHFTTFIVIAGVAKPIIQITTCDELQAVKDNLSGAYSVMNDIDCSATSSWNGGEGFVPIGNSTNKFTGTLDGNNYSITNLYINRTPVDMNDNSADWQGLFGYVGAGAVLANIKLVNVNITGRVLIGGLAGQISNATITNCHTSGMVQTAASEFGEWPDGYIGGLVGEAKFSSISKSSSTATVNSSGGTSGGLVGYLSGGSTSNSYARGNVTGSNNSGGFAGFDNGSTRYSYSTGTVACSQEYCKGFIGKDWGLYSNDAPNFWDRETSGKTNANGVGRISKTTAEMKTESTFTDAGWDFDNIWAIDPAINDGYPYLAGPTVNSVGPIITTESATNPTADSVTITWTTNHPATSRVIYDTVSHSSLETAPNYGYAYSTTEDVTLVTNHSVTVTSLYPDMTYYFRAVSHGSPE